MTKKYTKKEMFAMVMALVESVECGEKEEMVNFLAHEIELLEKKRSNTGQTKTQKENEGLMVQLTEALAEVGKPVTITEFQNLSGSEVATLSNQKLSALLKKLIETGEVHKKVIKKKTYFSITPFEEE